MIGWLNDAACKYGQFSIYTPRHGEGGLPRLDRRHESDILTPPTTTVILGPFAGKPGGFYTICGVSSYVTNVRQAAVTSVSHPEKFYS